MRNVAAPPPLYRGDNLQVRRITAGAYWDLEADVCYCRAPLKVTKDALGDYQVTCGPCGYVFGVEAVDFPDGLVTDPPRRVRP